MRILQRIVQNVEQTFLSIIQFFSLLYAVYSQSRCVKMTTRKHFAEHSLSQLKLKLFLIEHRIPFNFFCYQCIIDEAINTISVNTIQYQVNYYDWQLTCIKTFTISSAVENCSFNLFVFDFELLHYLAQIYTSLYASNGENNNIKH